MQQFFTKIKYFPRIPILWLIKFYQKTISPDHGLFKHRFAHGYCPYTPSCSEYGYKTIQKKGLMVGIPKTLWRIIRCNPWTKGGVDLP